MFSSTQRWVLVFSGGLSYAQIDRIEKQAIRLERSLIPDGAIWYVPILPAYRDKLLARRETERPGE